MEAQTDAAPRRRPRLHWLVLAAVAVALALLRVGPVFTTSPPQPDQVFLGFPYSIEDTLQYADFVAQVRDHDRLLLANRFSLEQQDPRLILLPIWLIGQLAALLGISVAVAWALAQALLIIGFVFVLDWLLGRFFPRPGQRLFAGLFILLAGGLDGWVVLLGDAWPEHWAAVLKRDLWPVLGWTPYMAMYNPLYLAGWLGLLGWLGLALLALERRWWAAGATAGGLVLLYLIHAYDAVVAAGALALAPLQALLLRLDGRAALRLAGPAALGLTGAAGVVAIGLWQAGDPLFARVAAAGHSGLFVSPLIWLLGFGGILLAAGYGMRRLARPGTRPALLFGWLVSSAGLSFAPVFEGRHFLYFVSLPLGVLAVDGLWWLAGRLRPARRHWWWIGLLAVLVFGNSLVRVTVRAFAHPQRDGRMFVTTGEARVASALRALPPGGVLASRVSCNWLPHRADHPCVMGHWFLSPDMGRQMTMFRRLVDPATPPAERDRILAAFGARYLFWGPREEALGVRPRPARVELLPLVRHGRAFLLEIRPPKR